MARMGSTPGASKTFQPRQSGLSSITVTLFAFAFIGRDFAYHQPCVYLIMADKLSKHSENAPGPWYVDRKRRLKIMLGVPSSRWLHGFQMIRSWLHPLARSEKLGFSCGCLLK